jgi:hypothetical protein
MPTKNFSPTEKKLLKFLFGSAENASVDLVRAYLRTFFPGSFYCESEANNADGYVKGKIVLETKNAQRKWLDAYFQALAQESELSFSAVLVVTPGFIGFWKVATTEKKHRDEVAKLIGRLPPNKIGERLGKQFAEDKFQIQKKALIFESGLTSVTAENESHLKSVLQELVAHLRSSKSKRVLIHPGNFHTFLPHFVTFFEGKSALSGVRNFYRAIQSWNIQSELHLHPAHLTKATINGATLDDIRPAKRQDLKQFVDQHYVGTKAGQDEDEFFSRYDAAIDAVSANFRKDHGIYFTDINLSRFAMWFVKKELGDIGSKYIVVDPACGSGNLVSNWRSPLQMKHKVISDLQPELLFAVEQRMKLDSWHKGKFTVIPKTEEERGLNFIDRSADEYLAEVKKYLGESGIDISKPLAFLCNPPYSGKSANSKRKKVKIDPSIVSAIGKKSSSDSYAAFIAQMRLITEKAKGVGLKENSLLLLFTQCGWLSQKNGSKKLRDYIFSTFEDRGAFIVRADEFFEKTGKWPIAFSIWEFKGEDAKLDKNRAITVTDLTALTTDSLSKINWSSPEMANKSCEKLFRSGRPATLGVVRERLDGSWLGVSRKDLSRPAELEDEDDIASEQKKAGLPKNDERRKNRTIYGNAKGSGVGFCLDLTPCRFDVSAVESNGEAPWFYLDSRFQTVGSNQCFSGIPDSRGYLANTFEKFRKASIWFSVARIVFSKGCPIWVNQEELWVPDMAKVGQTRFDEMAMLYVLANNSCVEASFPSGNPVAGTSKIYCQNPLSVLESASFWNTSVFPNLKILTGSLASRTYDALLKVYREWEHLLGRGKTLEVEYDAAYFIASHELSTAAGIRQIRDYQAHNPSLKLSTALMELDVALRHLEDEMGALLIDVNKINYFQEKIRKKTGTEAR